MAVPSDQSPEPPVLRYVDTSLNQVTPATTLTAVVALVMLAFVAAALVGAGYEVIDTHHSGRLASQQVLDPTLLILPRPRTFEPPAIGDHWWLTFALTACAACATSVIWTGIAAQRVLRMGRLAMSNLRLRAWTLAVVATICAAVVSRYATHLRGVFRGWEVVSDILYVDTGPLTVATIGTVIGSLLLALWIELRHRRITAGMPHSEP